ncbi:MAG: adenylate/guanylate cyclase domain-containing protein [Bacteroidota bacterium]|nr:adenylate/guanylate cyclase domain-containing protein [Bacteroidota bacterium]
MVSLADINQVLSKKRNLDSKLVLLREFLNENNLDFCFFSLSKTFSKRFEISNFDLLEDYHQYSFFQDKQFGQIDKETYKKLKKLSDFDLKKKGVISTIFFFKKPVALIYLFSKKKKLDQLNNICQYISFYLDSFIREFHLQSKFNDKNNVLQGKLLEIESIFKITELLNSHNQNQNDLYQNILIYIISTLNASKGMILIKNINSGSYDIITSMGIDDDSFQKKIIRDTKGVLRDLKNSKSTMIVDDVKNYMLTEFSQANCLVSPIISQKNLHGAIIICDKETRSGYSSFDQFDLRLYDNITKKISLSFDNIVLLETLSESKKSVDNIMSSISTGIIQVNILGEIDYINTSALKVFNFDKDNVVGNHYYMVFEKNNKLISLIEKIEESKEILFESNFDIKDNNDKKHQINLTISPVFDENEKNSGVVLSFEDLSGINKVKSTFKKYVSESIVDELLENETSLELGGSEKEVCVLFADIRGFTALSEKMEASKVVYVLNNYFQSMIDVIFKHNGTLDKIIGDELMVLYGVPLKTDNDPQNAVNSAIEMLFSLENFNKKMESEGLPKLEIGIGINFGNVVSGNIGSDQQMNYTVIGDNVNLAARLCSNAKPGEIIISNSVYNFLDDKSKFIKSVPLSVKGKSKPIDNWLYKHKISIKL